ncbi:MAG TPA: SAM-dependent methyltransferase [Micromonosporaceae bacterium]|nr:SAM-dependent methyltransferase [Micromonosporaceae bacterium]
MSAASTAEGPLAGGPSRRYALLVAPSSNRVYGQAAPGLARAELAVFAETVLAAEVVGIGPRLRGGVPYLDFVTATPLSAVDVAYLSNLSCAYALFEVVEGEVVEGEGGGELLRPVELAPLARYDEDLVTIPKYAGKTNEQFTRLLLNVTVLASAKAPAMLAGGLAVLDPLCGRGTTLNHALRYGYDAVGIEVDGADVDAYAAFIKTWLRRKRVKHRAEMHPVRRDRRRVARCLDVVIGGDQRLTVFHADTLDARDFLRAGCVDVVVADTPYGVAHGSRTPDKGLSRRPLDLLAAAVPVWAELLRPGGALGVSWNTHVAARSAAAATLAAAGLEVVDSPGYRGFEHWVDQAITRDVLVARKPGRGGRPDGSRAG